MNEQGSDLLTVSGGKGQLTGADVQSIRVGGGWVKSKEEEQREEMMELLLLYVL